MLVAGTHGKTTTSAMCAHVLNNAGAAVSHYVGAEIPVLGANAHWDGGSEYLVAEGDESDGTLDLYRPAYAVVLNIEEEHLDYYQGLQQIVGVFRTLLEQTSGKAIYCREDSTAYELCSQYEGGLSYGWSDADYTAVDVAEVEG